MSNLEDDSIFFEELFEEMNILIAYYKHKADLEAQSGGHTGYYYTAELLEKIKERLITGNWSNEYQNILNEYNIKQDPEYLELERLAAKFGKQLK